MGCIQLCLHVYAEWRLHSTQNTPSLLFSPLYNDRYNGHNKPVRWMWKYAVFKALSFFLTKTSSSPFKSPSAWYFYLSCTQVKENDIRNSHSRSKTNFERTYESNRCEGVWRQIVINRRRRMNPVNSIHFETAVRRKSKTHFCSILNNGIKRNLV